MTITAAMVKELREQTGAPMLDCKRALEATQGDLEKALAWLDERGLAKAAKKASRETSEGLVYAYIHPGNRVGVLVEVNCETDFVARGETFRQLCHDLTLHIAMANPLYLGKEDVPQTVIDEKLAHFKALAIEEGKPANIAEKIAAGRMEKFYGEEVLLEQPFVKDEDITVGKLIAQTVGTIGENMRISRFVRYELGNH